MLLALTPCHAEEDAPLNLSVGFDYTSGKFGTAETTKLLSIPVAVSYDMGNDSLSLTLTRLHQTGPTGHILLGGRPVGKIVSNEIKTVSGIGDTIASYTHYFDPADDAAPMVDVKGLVKFGTADPNQGLGTGKNDFSLQTDISQIYHDAIALSGSLGYTAVGKPKNAGLRNYYYGSVDGAYKFSKIARIGMTYDTQQSPTAGTPGSRDVNFYFGYKPSKASSVRMSVLKGLSSGSADWGVSASADFDF